MGTFLVLEEKRINARSSLNLNFKLQIMLLNQCLWKGNIGESSLQRKYMLIIIYFTFENRGKMGWALEL